MLNTNRQQVAGKVALITGGDSGVGRTRAFAKESADCAIVYLEEHSNAQETQKLVEQNGQKCLLLPGDAGKGEQR